MSMDAPRDYLSDHLQSEYSMLPWLAWPLRTEMRLAEAARYARKFLHSAIEKHFTIVHQPLCVQEVGAWRDMEAAATRRATSLRSELTLRYC